MTCKAPSNSTGKWKVVTCIRRRSWWCRVSRNITAVNCRLLRV